MRDKRPCYSERYDKRGEEVANEEIAGYTAPSVAQAAPTRATFTTVQSVVGLSKNERRRFLLSSKMSMFQVSNVSKNNRFSSKCSKCGTDVVLSLVDLPKGRVVEYACLQDKAQVLTFTNLCNNFGICTIE